MKIKSPECPYCKRKISFFTAWLSKNKGDYTCPRCKNTSVVVHDIKLPYIAIAAVFTAVCLYIILRVILKSTSWQMIFYILPPYIIFSIVSAFLVKFKRPVRKKNTGDHEDRKIQ